MTQAVTVYRWDDPGAPQLENTKPNNVFNLFKKCLVEGYGDKEAAGWSLVKESAAGEAPRLVIKNNDEAGTGGVAMFASSDNSDNQRIYLRSGQNYIDSDTYENANGYFAFKGGIGAEKATNWFVLATSTAFHFFAFSNYLSSNNKISSYYMPYLFIGDFLSNYDNDPSKFISICGKQLVDSDSYSNSTLYLLNNKANGLFKVYPLDGQQTPSDASLTSIFGNKFYSEREQNADANITMLSPIYICLGNADFSKSYIQSDSQPFIRGRVPGLFVADKAGFLSSEMPTIKQLNNQAHYLLPSSNGGTSAIWINMEEW